MPAFLSLFFFASGRRSGSVRMVVGFLGAGTAGGRVGGSGGGKGWMDLLG